MKKKKSLNLSLNKKKISELNISQMDKVKGGYPGWGSAGGGCASWMCTGGWSNC
ncbi:class I lanthipeptide [Flagellimonas meridianipacifica]|uniref:Uncharacterized protein n=1 Tax=Flagellimonas meridianipacifica TaxID=1080225 RepID=A0A2T0MJ04_9FLAO|nr:class I lanthipeptide [Allomuricauda pacifica]PRX57535.1 hypothetical protein CLV81_1541 [Allomuricauda pacifica]